MKRLASYLAGSYPGGRSRATRRHHDSWLARASLGLGGLPLASQPAPVAGPEDEKKGEDGERQRPGRDRELLANRVSDDGGARAGAERRHEEDLLGADTSWRERERARYRLHAHHQQHVFEGPADVEGIEEEPERGEAKQPADELPGRDPARVAGGLAEDHKAQLEPPPERLDTAREDREQSQPPDSEHREQEQQDLGMSGPIADLEGGQVGESRRSRQQPLGDRVEQDQRAHHRVEWGQHRERGDYRRIGGALDAALCKDDLHRIAAVRGKDAVQAPRRPETS